MYNKSLQSVYTLPSAAMSNWKALGEVSSVTIFTCLRMQIIWKNNIWVSDVITSLTIISELFNKKKNASKHITLMLLSWAPVVLRQHYMTFRIYKELCLLEKYFTYQCESKILTHPQNCARAISYLGIQMDISIFCICRCWGLSEGSLVLNWST